MDYWFDPTRTKSPKLDKLIERATVDAKIPAHQKINYIAHKFMIGGLENRSREHRLTGEWIVFKKNSGVNYYLSLASHVESEDDIVNRIKDCIADFPELTPLLRLT